MDIRRTVIFIGLAISSYFLILAWNDDYGQKPQMNAPIESSASADTPDIPVASATAEAGSTESEAPQVDEAPAISSAAPSGALISVETDVLKVKIDPRGGEIVEVLLPEFPASIDTPDVPFVLMERNERRTYVAQSGLIASGTDAKVFSAEKTSYQLADGEDEIKVVLTTSTDQVNIEKVFTFRRGDYLTDVNFRVTNTSEQPWSGRFYAQLKRDGSDDPSKNSSMGMAAYLGAALTTKDDRYKKVSFGDLEDGQFKSIETGGWAAILQHYFLAAWVPPKEEEHTYNGRYVKGNYIFGFYDEATVVEPGQTAEVGSGLYMGPKDQDRLSEIAENLELTVDYGWLWWIAQPLFWLLQHIHALVGNWGVAIILLTVLVKAAFFKLSATSYRSMANMRKVAPKMNEIKEKYGDNREKLGQEMMKLYKEEKINPLGGCLPILVQMPVFISLYWVLMESVELRQAPFMLWIKDMSVMDPYFILPLIMGASMFLQMKLNPTPPDPMQARVMQFMPIIFTIFFLWFPAGLVLYWVTNNVLSIAQQYVITRQIEKAA